MGYFSFDRDVGRFRLESIHLGHSLQQIVESTGFSFDRGNAMGMTPLPDD